MEKCIFFVIIYFIFYYNLNFFIEKYNKFNTLKQLTQNSSVSKNPFIIYYKTFSIIFKSYYLILLQYFNNSVKHIGNNYYEISYIINNKPFKLIVKQKRGPSIIQQITNNNKDITYNIIPYLGPNNDWHKNNYSPSLLGYSNLEITLTNGNKKIFTEDDLIDLNF